MSTTTKSNLTYRASFPNPIATAGGFTHYEIQAVRDWQAPDGCRFTEPVFSEEDADPSAGLATGLVYYGVYGRYAVGGVEHLFDRSTVESALETLAHMGIKE